MLDKFLNQFNSERTKKCYHKDITDFLLNRDIENVKPSEIIEYLNKIKTRSSATTANRSLSAIKSYFRFLVAEEVVDKNPAESLRGFRTSVKSPTIAISDTQVAKLISTAKGTDKLILASMAYLGLRRDELREVRMSDISTIHGTGNFFLKVRKGKGDKMRQIPIHPNLWEIIKHNGGEEYLIEIKPKNKIGENHIYRVVKKYGKLIGVDELTPHSFRATVISQMFEKGVNVRDIAQFAGHSSLVTTQGYDKKRDGLLSSAALGVSY